jgi:predicted nuclease of predicted toxin-antitoxin system
VWGGARLVLGEDGHDVLWAGDLAADPGDLELLRLAHAEGRVLVTLDKDFGELAIVKAEPHSGIVRLVGFEARQQGPICSRVLTLHSEDLALAAIVTVEPGRIRVRLPSRE